MKVATQNENKLTLSGRERCVLRLKGRQRLKGTSTEGTFVLQLACSWKLLKDPLRLATYQQTKWVNQSNPMSVIDSLNDCVHWYIEYHAIHTTSRSIWATTTSTSFKENCEPWATTSPFTTTLAQPSVAKAR